MAQDFTLTPAIDLYPTIHSGQSAVLASSDRVKAGESVTLRGAGGSNTNVYIKGADLLSDIGDLSTLAVDAANASIAVASKRLQKIKIGDEVAENVTSNLASINIGECPSLMLVDARNLASLSGTVDLTQCPRLREAYFGGTDVRAISLANGSKLTKLQLPNTITQISMQNLKFLEGTGLDKGDLSNVEFYRVENCPHLDAFGMLKELYNAESKSLRNIRVIGFVYDGDATDVDMMMNLAKDIAADGSVVDYAGIDSEGTPQQTLVPIIEGTLNIAGSVYADSAEFVREQYPNLVLNVTGGYYIRFADKAVQTICATNWGDGTGITEAQASEVTSLGTKFKGNTTITEFMELGKFDVTEIIEDGFNGCTNLIKADLSKISVLNSRAFINCANFAGDGNGDLVLPSLTSIASGVFGGNNTVQCTGLRRVLDLGSITILPNSGSLLGVFRNQINLTEVHLPETLTTIGNACFELCSSLTDINFPLSLTNIGEYAFNGCTSLEIEDLSLPNLEAIGIMAFNRVKITNISNLGKLTSLPNLNVNQNIFGDKTTLTSVNLPSTLTSIGNSVFNGYSSLTSVNLPSSLTKIG